MSHFSKLARWLKRLTKKKPRRLELRLVTYDVANFLMTCRYETWKIADEENLNAVIGHCYVERLSRGDEDLD